MRTMSACSTAEDGPGPRFSVVISGFKATARDTVRRCLELDAVPGGYEVLFVDNTSDSRHEGFARNLLAQPLRDGVSLRYVGVREPGKAAAQNAALRLSAGEFVVCLDDDVLPASDLLSEYARAFATYPCAAVQGRVELFFEGGGVPPAWLDARLRLDLAEMDFGRVIYPFEMGLTGANMAFRRSVFKTYGPFDERFGPGRTGTLEDQEYSERIRAGGETQLYWPGASVRHRIPSERLRISSFMRTYYIVGYSDCLLRPPAGKPGAFRLAFYMVRRILERHAKALVGLVRGQRAVAVFNWCEAVQCWGYYRQFLDGRRDGNGLRKAAEGTFTK